MSVGKKDDEQSNCCNDQDTCCHKPFVPFDIPFDRNKKRIDEAFEITKLKYGESHASIALYDCFVNYIMNGITRTNNARSNMIKFEYHSSEIDQFLIEYAMASFISNNIDSDFSLSDIRKYVDTGDETLKYDKASIIALVAIGGAWNSYWMTDLLSCNQKVKAKLVEYLIEERYINNKKNILDNCRRSKMVKLKDGKEVHISINRLNRNVDNMIRDDEATYFEEDNEDYGTHYTR